MGSLIFPAEFGLMIFDQVILGSGERFSAVLVLCENSWIIYLDPEELPGRSYLYTCPPTFLLSEKDNRIFTLPTHR